MGIARHLGLGEAPSIVRVDSFQLRCDARGDFYPDAAEYVSCHRNMEAIPMHLGIDGLDLGFSYR
jgi:hypothetical protein